MVLGLLASGCNKPCQTYCLYLTDYWDGCVTESDEETSSSSTDVTWQSLGAADYADYGQKCDKRFENALLVARTEERNLIYDWCADAMLAVAATTTCGDLELPDNLEIGEEDQEDENQMPGL